KDVIGPPTDETLEALRERVAAMLADAKASLADLEDENHRIRGELQLVLSNRGRRTLAAAQHRIGRAIALLLHPFWVANTALRHLVHRGPIGTVRLTAQRLLLRRTSFRGLEPIERKSDLPDVNEAIRWIGRVKVSGETHDALLCHPPSSVEYEASCLGRTTIVAPCTMLPVVWAQNEGGAVFTVTARSASGWSTRRAIRVNPHSRWRDRKWKRLKIAVPGDSGLTTVRVTLTTSLPFGAGVAHAWAVWGEPHLRAWRSREEVTGSIRALFAKIRAFGIKATIEQIRDAEGADLDADLFRRWLTVNALTDERIRALKADVQTFAYMPTISVLTPVYNTDPQWLRACIESVRGQIYPNWEHCLADDGSTSDATKAVLREYQSDSRIRVTSLETNSGISAASNAALAMATGEFVALLDHDDEYTADGLYQMVKHLNARRDADVVYSDEDKLDLAGARCDPYFKPDWSPEHFLACMYTPHLLMARRTLVQQVGGFRVGYDGAQDYDLLLRMSEKTSRIDHVPRILYHWRKLPQSTASAGEAKPWAMDAGHNALEDAMRRRGVNAEVLPGAATGLYRVRFRIEGEPLVSLIIPTTGTPRRIGGAHVDTLRTLVRSVRQKTSYPRYEFVIIADNGQISEDVRRTLEGSAYRLVPYQPGASFNFSHKINVGAAHGAGTHLLLLNDDIEVISSDWMTAMLEYSQQREIGAVGGKLLYPDGRLQHIGIVLGVGGGAAHAFHQRSGACPGYASSAVSVRNYSAVTAACLMTRREAFDSVGGFDETLAVDFNDVDYCLRLRKAGYRIVFTPFATLYHHESASFGPRIQSSKELELMRARWGDVIDNDPYYHPELTREFPDYRIRV
ncbi:MAG TPA: glycosyltransferase, partial [Vicinamibacterales bacterium]